jgi:WD40 repeat protein
LRAFAAGLVWGVVSGESGSAGVRAWCLKLSEVTVCWQVHTLTRHSGPVYSVAISRDGTRVVSGSEAGLVKIWDVETGAEVSSFVGVRWGEAMGVLRGFRVSPVILPWQWSEERVLWQVCTLTGHGLRIPGPD